MVFLQVFLIARTQNVQYIQMPQANNWHLEIKCAHCNQKFPKQVTCNKFEEHQMQKQHGNANLIAKCKNCQRASSLRIDPKSSYKVQANQDGLIKGSLVIFQCRGIEILKIDVGNSLTVKVKGSPTTFQNADFTDSWGQYDQNISALAEVQDVTTEFHIAK